MAECVNCNKEIARGETMLSDVGLMCKECYAEREGLTIEEVEKKEKEPDSEEKDRKILLLSIFALSLIMYSYGEISSRGFVTLFDVFTILIACGIYVPVILKWRKIRPVLQGLFLFIMCTPIIWFFWILFRERKEKGKLIFSLNKLY